MVMHTYSDLFAVLLLADDVSYADSILAALSEDYSVSARRVTR